MKNNKTILVVDDQPDNVFILQDRLQREGFRILTAYDGLTCISIAESEKPDLILLDVMMPGLSGFDVCERLIKNTVTSSIPIILVTALTDVEDIKRGLQAGAFDYIKKPYNRAELIARINSALRFSETQKMLIEIEKVNTYAATVLTANHEIKQPLTLINLSLTAINRELGKEEIRKDVLKKRIEFIEGATKEIIKILGKLSEIKKPVITDYVNNLKMIDLNSSDISDDSSNQF
jgi:DNA-binding response OmpR family regulator